MQTEELKNINHYVCSGECKTVSENPGICNVQGCSRNREVLVSCTCSDGKHREIWEPQLPTPTVEGF